MPKRHGLVFIPVCRVVGGDAIDQEGTAVLVGTNGRWLFTAAHVIERHEVVLLPGTPMVPISKERFGISPPSLDLAYAELAPREADNLMACGLRFLPLEKLDGGTGAFPPDRNGCVISGYPADSVAIDGDAGRIKATPTTVTSQFLTPDEMAQARLDARHQIAARFGGLSANKGKLKRFDPKGLSGGAIWRVAGEARLAGIVTDYDPRRRIVIGTRIRPMLQEIERGLREMNDTQGSAPR